MDVAVINKIIFERVGSFGRLEQLFECVIQAFERQKEQSFLWIPVFVAVGIGLYFSLPLEPPFILSAVLLGIAVAGNILAEKGHFLKTLSFFVLLVSVGFLAAQCRTFFVHTPVLEKKIGPVEVVGRVDAIEGLGKGAGSRLLLSHLDIERLSSENTPVKVRLKIRKDTGLDVGQRVRVLAVLNPPSPPVMPGGFDFQRYMYFQQIGAVGFIYREAEILQNAPSFFRFFKIIEAIRYDISIRIERSLKAEQAGIAEALMIGKSGAISQEDMEAVRGAGLAHMLAISGLHIGLFSGILFFLSRFLMVLIPSVALHHPTKKYAAVFAIAGAFVYMLLAGANIPAQRAMIMTGIVFFAIILDRSPLSLRLVAFAALVVLLLFPESLLSASFHMSFAAVSALIVFYNGIRPLWSRLNRKAGFLRKMALYFLGVCMTSIIAGLATAPFALFHFQQLALYSLLGNILAMPVLAFVVMPSAVLALFAMPMGLEAFPLMFMGAGIDIILDVSHWVFNLPHAVLGVKAWPHSALVCFVCGVVFMTLWKGWFKSAGLLPIFASIMLIMQNNQADILISSNYDLVAFRDHSGGLNVSTRRKAAFVRKNWERSYGLKEGESRRWPSEGVEGGMTCGELGCRFILKGYKISYLLKGREMSKECDWADLLLSKEPVPYQCRSKPVIDRFDVLRNGAYAVFLKEREVFIENAQEKRGNRPWAKVKGEAFEKHSRRTP